LSAPSDSANALLSAPPSPSPTVESIAGTIARLVHEVIGEADFDLEITADTSFSDDIELESIEFVALGEQLQLTYGEAIDLIGWFGELELDQIIDLTVGELAQFIAACLAGVGAGAAHSPSGHGGTDA
jgi:acyl carrier protein